MVSTLRLAGELNERDREGDIMIRNDEELTLTRDQLLLIEDALVALRREILPKNRKNYEVLSEGYIQQITTLRAEIDAYLGVAPVK
jgi:hypothetical protein